MTEIINDEGKFVSLSYESYLSDAINSFKEIKSVENMIYSEESTFASKLSVIKNQYRSMSTEDDKSKMFDKFKATIKQWFIKIWEFLCTIFSKIQEIVLSLIKSLIIFIQKKRIQSHNIIKLIEDKGLVGFNAANNDIINKMFEKNPKIKTYQTSSTVRLSAYNIHDLIESPTLEGFIKSNIILKNPNSIFSTDSLTKYFNTELFNEDESENKKLDILANAVDEMYGDAILANEVDPKHKNNFLKRLCANHIANRDITGLAHFLTYHCEKPIPCEVPLSFFFESDANGLQSNISNLKILFRQYYEDTKKIIGPNGYIQILQDTLKKYKEQVKADNDNIKAMQKMVIEKLNSIGTDTEKDEKIQNRIKRFTAIVMKVKNVKSHFVRLRQTVILDLITLYSIENNAWYMITGKAGLLTDDTGFKNSDELSEDSDPIINIDSSESFDEKKIESSEVYVNGFYHTYKNTEDFVKSDKFKSRLSKLKEKVNKKGFKFATKHECETLPKAFFQKLFRGTVGKELFTKWYEIDGIRFAAIVTIEYNYGIEIGRWTKLYAMIKKPNNKLTSILYAQAKIEE